MTKNQFAFNVVRLFQERGIDYVDFEENTYENDTLRPYCPLNSAFTICVYIKDGDVYFSTESEKGMLSTFLVREMDNYEDLEFFLEGLFNDTYDFVSNEETDGDYEEFVEESKKDDKIFKVLRKRNIPGDYHTSDGQLMLYIEDGDWKHDHHFAQWEMEKVGFEYICQEDDPSDSDCYTATHYYRLP